MKKLIIIFIFGFIGAWIVSPVFAALNLSVSPLTGGNNLRFGRVPASGLTNKEVRIRITSTDGNQYQVFHRINDSFVNEKNVSVASNALSTYTLIGSNASGTLYAQNPERLGFTDQLLYTSSTGGTSDAFTAVYAVDGSRIGASGNFLGRIQYTLRPIGGSSQDTVILNVTIEASGKFKINIEGSSSTDSVHLNYKDEHSREGYVEFSFEENRGENIEIYQEIEPYLQDQLFNEINSEAVMFMATGNVLGELQPQALTTLTRKRTLIYTSKTSEGSFRLNFTLNKEAIEQQKAGNYEGQLKYIVHSDSEQRVKNIRLRVNVEPIFTIKVDLPPQGLSFERLLPDSQPIVREIGVQVKTNLGKPYMVMQHVVSPMTNEKGEELPDQYFTYKGEVLNQQTGKVSNDDYREVPRGETSLFISDNKGSPSQFQIGYRLRPFSTMVPGDYSTSIRYSLGEI